MPNKKTIQSARKKRTQGKAPSTQAGAFVREEMEHIRQGKHGAKNTKQAIAIGLSKARRAGVPLRKPPRGTPSAQKEKHVGSRKISPSGRKSLSKARTRVLRHEGHSAASPTSLRRQAKAVARRRSPAARRQAARKAARTRMRRAA